MQGQGENLGSPNGTFFDTKDVSLSDQKYCGLDMAGDKEPGNLNSNFFNSIVEIPLIQMQGLAEPWGQPNGPLLGS